jgi:hypothetical protein
MPPFAFALLAGIALTVFAGISITVLVRPSQYIRWSRNPWMEDTPWTRLQMRAVGLVFCLAVIMVVSGILSGNRKSAVLQGFHENILIALWLAFIATWIVGIVSFILWRIMAFRIFIRTHFDSERLGDTAWERRMSVLFCSVLASIVAIAIVLAVGGYHG